MLNNLSIIPSNRNTYIFFSCQCEGVVNVVFGPQSFPPYLSFSNHIFAPAEEKKSHLQVNY
jgi:hypothetical protein